jgi:hypothetical protein
MTNDFQNASLQKTNQPAFIAALPGFIKIAWVLRLI